MGIRFSPGCECCYSYVAYVKGINIFGGTITFGIAGFIPLEFVFVTGNGTYGVLVSNEDLSFDVATNPVFTPNNLGLPIIAPNQVQIKGYNQFLPSLDTPGTYKLVFGGTIGFTATVDFGLYLLSGSRGSWNIIGHKIKTVTDVYENMNATFNIDANGVIT